MTQDKHVPDRPKKRPYCTPKLVEHGNLSALTKAKGGSRSDGSKPSTRVPFTSGG